MEDKKRFGWYFYAEMVLHLAYWLFHFSSVNTNWEADWTDRSVRGGVSQVTILLYPLIFYLNAFWLIPRFLKPNRWINYGLRATAFTLILEVIRSLFFVWKRGESGSFAVLFQNEFHSVDNLVFGLPNSLVFAFLFSTIYRFTRDWIVTQRVITSMQSEKMQLTRRLEDLEASTKENGTLISEELTERLAGILDQRNNPYKKSFQAKRRDQTYLIRTHQIAYFKAQGDFVLAYDSNGDSFILNHSISVLEESLDPNLFFRINRSEIINSAFLLKYSNHIKNRLEIHLVGVDEALYTSNNKTPEFRLWLDKVG